MAEWIIMAILNHQRDLGETSRSSKLAGDRETHLLSRTMRLRSQSNLMEIGGRLIDLREGAKLAIMPKWVPIQFRSQHNSSRAQTKEASTWTKIQRVHRESNCKTREGRGTRIWIQVRLSSYPLAWRTKLRSKCRKRIPRLWVLMINIRMLWLCNSKLIRSHRVPANLTLWSEDRANTPPVQPPLMRWNRSRIR